MSVKCEKHKMVMISSDSEYEGKYSWQSDELKHREVKTTYHYKCHSCGETVVLETIKK